ncbi:pPIWI_RE module domain-containing protein [Streptomyces coelicoflavus]|uniref:pPIWI_RE module domain-containing protein n=1 Tax=Streptomyces coelicoflavus TaxID=285562 RepID=UPI003F4A048F
MPVNYRTVRTAAWLPADAGTTLTAGYRALPFPEQWRDAVLALCNAGRDPQAEQYRTVPTRRLEQVLQAFAPDVLVLPRPPFHEQGEEPERWLYVADDAPDPLPPHVLTPLLGRWLRELRPEPEHRPLLKNVRAQLAEHPPEWEPVARELLACGRTRGGTAAPASHQFTLTTDWLARRVLALGPYPYEGGRLHFRAMPRGPRDQGAELVSQPLPYEPSPGKGTWWFSVVLNITLHTVPFDPLPRFHLHWSIRRWATRMSPATGRVRLPYGSRTTVLLRPWVPVLPGVPLSERYAVAQLERRWDKERGGFADGWAFGGPARLLQDVSLGEPFPDADAILTEPEEWLRRDARAGIVYRTAMGGHEVKAGLMPNQCSELTAWVQTALPPELRAAPDLTHTALAAAKPLNAPPSSVPKEAREEEETRRCAERRAAVAFAVAELGAPRTDDGRPVLEARLLWQSAEMRDAALGALGTRLGLKGGGGSFTEREYDAADPGHPVVHEWKAPELTVRVRCLRPVVRHDDGTGRALTAGLGLPEGVRRTREEVTAAVGERRAETAAWLTGDRTGDAPALALVEIDRPADFASRDHDPKFALRLGCADAGFVTQFVALPKKTKGYNSLGSMDHRALMAWDDGLRQLGARVHPEHGIEQGVPQGMRYAAVWMVRKNHTARNRWAADVPVAVLVTPQAPGSGLARVQGWDPDADDGAGAWVPYPVMLLTLTRLAEVRPSVPAPRVEGEVVPAGRRRGWRADREEQRRTAEEWLQKVRASLRRRPTMLLVDAQNARSHWTWLQDGRTERDRIRDGHAEPRRLAPDLRLVRVRTGKGRETAQWWGVNPKEGPNGIASHLWIPEDDGTGRVFYSTTPKPVQFSTSAVEADKLAPRPLRMGKRKGELTIDTGTVGWMPALVELAVLGCHTDDGDDPQALALAAHLLRQPPDYPQALALPLPLHLAGLGQQYVLPTRPDGEADPVDGVEAAAEGARVPAVPAGEESTADAAADPDPATAAAAGLTLGPEQPEADDEQEQLALFGF